MLHLFETRDLAFGGQSVCLRLGGLRISGFLQRFRNSLKRGNWRMRDVRIAADKWALCKRESRACEWWKCDDGKGAWALWSEMERKLILRLQLIHLGFPSLKTWTTHCNVRNGCKQICSSQGLPVLLILTRFPFHAKTPWSPQGWDIKFRAVYSRRFNRLSGSMMSKKWQRDLRFVGGSSDES